MQDNVAAQKSKNTKSKNTQIAGCRCSARFRQFGIGTSGVVRIHPKTSVSGDRGDVFLQANDFMGRHVFAERLFWFQ